MYAYLPACLSLDSGIHYTKGPRLLVHMPKVSRRFNFLQTPFPSLLSLLTHHLLILENTRAYKKPWLPRVSSLCPPHTRPELTCSAYTTPITGIVLLKLGQEYSHMEGIREAYAEDFDDVCRFANI